MIKECDLDERDVSRRRDVRSRRVSHNADACPCRTRGGVKAVVVVSKGGGGKRGKKNRGGVVVVPGGESEDKICVVMDECENGRKGRRLRNSGGSLDRDRRMNAKRFSITSTTSSVSMLSTGAGDVNNNNYNNCSNNYSGVGINRDEEGQGQGDGDVDCENKRNEVREEMRRIGSGQFGSVSSFTKDIMRMIDNRNIGHGDDEDDDDDDNDDTVNEEDRLAKNKEKEDPQLERRASEVILKMNRRNSDMSERGRLATPVVLCDCPCHDEVVVVKRLKSPNAGPGNIYSIEDDDEGNGIEKGQLELQSDAGEGSDDDALRYEDEEAVEDDGRGRRRRRDAGGL